MREKLPLLLRNSGVRVAAVLILAQVAGYYLIAGQDKKLPNATLNLVPKQLQNWKQVGEEGVVEQEVLDLLKADQLLNRIYSNNDGTQSASLFVAFYKSQRAGVSPHSPKVCLPGSGWMPRDSKTLSLTLPGLSEPIPVNRYVVTKGEYKSVVLYWYQSFDRAVADEYKAKLYLMADAVRYRRSDTSVIRVVIAVAPGQTEDQAQQQGEEFIREFYPAVRSNLPS
jgi:EpsI family protein